MNAKLTKLAREICNACEKERSPRGNMAPQDIENIVFAKLETLDADLAIAQAARELGAALNDHAKATKRRDKVRAFATIFAMEEKLRATVEKGSK